MSDPRDRCIIRNFLARGGEKVEIQKEVRPIWFNIQISLHKWNLQLRLSVFCAVPFFQFFSPQFIHSIFFLISHKIRLSLHLVRESQAHLLTISNVLAKKKKRKTKLTPSAAIAALIWVLSLSFYPPILYSPNVLATVLNNTAFLSSLFFT